MTTGADLAAGAYRHCVLAQMPSGATEAERGTVREQFSGACTTKIAAFDVFACRGSRRLSLGTLRRGVSP